MFRIARDAVDARALEAILRDGDGGFVTFVGIVRGRGDDGRAVRGLSYEAYEPLAHAAFEEIASEARERFGDVRIAIVHRIGDLLVGEIAVAVAAAAAHRAEAFAACAYAVDELKRRAPIWKKEAYLDGASQWCENLQ